VEHKIAHYVRAAWGGRKARTRGKARIATDADTRAAAVNWARRATLGLHMADGRWAAAPPERRSSLRSSLSFPALLVPLAPKAP